MSVAKRSRLSELLAYSSNKIWTERESRLEETRNRQDKLDRFCAVRRDLIRPSMHAFSNLFHGHNVNSLIVNDDNYLDELGRKLYRASITLRIFMNATAYDGLMTIPHYSILWDEINSVVRFFRNSSTRSLAGESGYVGKCFLQELNSDLVEEKLIAFATWLLNDIDLRTSPRGLY